MATVQSDGYTYILMKDVQGEKAPGMIKAVLMGSAPKRVQLLRGELLSSIPQRERDRVPRNDGTSAHNFRSKKDPSVTLYVDDTNVCPAMGKEVQLLEAIEKPYDRFTVFSMENRLEWGSGLGKGDQVFVKLPTPNTSVPTWSIGLVRYAESVDGLPGWNFGVEIKDYRYLERGSTDGVFGGYRYFQCDENCGLFVSLEKLAPEPPPSPGADYSVAKKPKNPPVDSSANTGKVSSHSFDPPVDQPHQHFKVNDRVVVYNKKNIAVHGTVRWTGRRVQTRTLESNHIGIETDTVAVTHDFAKALTGVSQLFRATPGQRLVVPEQFVFREDLVDTCKPPAQDFDLSNPTAAACQLRMTERQLMAEQVRMFREAKEIKKNEDKARKAEEMLKRNKEKNEKTDSELEQVKNALRETIDVTAQKEAIEAFNKEKQEQNKQKKTQREQEQARAQAESQQQGRQQFQKQSSHQSRADHPYEPPPGEGSPRPPCDERGGAAPHAHIREHEMVYGQNIERGHRQNSYPQGGRLDHDPHRGVGQVSDVRYQGETQIGANQYGMKREGSQGRLAPLNEAKDKYAHYVNFPPPEDHLPREQLHPNNLATPQLYNQGQGYGNQPAPSQIYSHGQERYDSHYPNMPQDAYPGHYQYPHEAPPQANLQPESQYDPRHDQQQHSHQTGQGTHHLPQQQPPQFAATCSVGTSNPFNLVVGSTVQLATTDPNDYSRYGVIKWIGTASGVQGKVAGIELEEYLDGCTDGTLKSTGQKFFNCAPGHGLYFPLASLSPDKRLVDATTQGQGHPGYSENLFKVSLDKREQKAPSSEIDRLKHEIDTLVAEKSDLQQKNEELLQEKSQYTERTNLQKLQLQQQVDSLLAEKKNLQQKSEELLQQTNQQKHQLQQSFTQQLAEKEQEIRQLEYQNQHFRAESERLLQESRDLRQQKKDLQLRLDAAPAPESSVSRFTRVQIPRLDQDSWNVHRRDVVLQGKLGHGAWGSVCKGIFRGQQVAVKCAHEEILYDTTIDQLKREIRIMAHIQHPNLVRLIAAVVDDGVERQTQSPLLILELLDTDLRSAYKKKVVNLNREVLLPIFRDVAYALHYLHEHQEPIIHRDVSAPNVLLQQTHPGVWRAKLSDFGSANLAKHCKTAGPGAIIYSAPETFPDVDPPPKQTIKIDVYSYGYLLVESITKEMPSREKRASMLSRISQEWAAMHNIITACTMKEPDRRLTMTQVLEKLHGIHVPPV